MTSLLLRRKPREEEMGLLIFIVILVIAACAIVALAFPQSNPGKWIAQAFRDVWNFI